ncbi:MAG: hypothetical protein ACE5JI_14490 [Acidobacteriota bacterium]
MRFCVSRHFFDRPRSALWALEKLIHIGLPAFVLLSLGPHVSAFFFRGSALVIIIYILHLKYRRRGNPSRYQTFVAILPFIVGIAYIDVIWHLYNVGRLQVYSDALYGYIPLSQMSIFDLDFWFFEVKPFVTPLIFKLCSRDMARVNDFFVTSYLLTTVFFLVAVSSLFAGFTEKVFVFYMLILFFLNQSLMGAWLTIAQSEVPAIVTTILMLGVFAYSYRKKDCLEQATKTPYWLMPVIFVSTFAFSFARDTNMYFLPFVILFYFLVFKKAKHRIVVTVMISSVFLLHNRTMEKAGRWRFPLANVLMRRIIPDDGLRKLFQEKYHLPDDAVVEPAANQWASGEFENKDLIFASEGQDEDWVGKYGLKSYRSFLITHPGYVVSEWVKHWNAYNAGFWRWTLRRGRKYRLNEMTFSFPGSISFFGAILILLSGLALMKENPLVSLTIVHSVVIGVIAYHGDAMEVERHLQQAAMTLRFSFLILVVLLYKFLKRHLRSGETP